MNDIISFTAVYRLDLDHQVNSFQNYHVDMISKGIFDSMSIMASNIYVAKVSHNKMLSKGVYYVRRSGSRLRFERVNKFLSIVL